MCPDRNFQQKKVFCCCVIFYNFDMKSLYAVLFSLEKLNFVIFRLHFFLSFARKHKLRICNRFLTYCASKFSLLILICVITSYFVNTYDDYLHNELVGAYHQFILSGLHCFLTEFWLKHYTLLCYVTFCYEFCYVKHVNSP